MVGWERNGWGKAEEGGSGVGVMYMDLSKGWDARVRM